MNHCSGGLATDAYDGLAALVKWIEKGQAPDCISAQASTTVLAAVKRPLCAYPKHAQYKRCGDTNDEANFIRQ